MFGFLGKLAAGAGRAAGAAGRAASTVGRGVGKVAGKVAGKAGTIFKVSSNAYKGYAYVTGQSKWNLPREDPIGQIAREVDPGRQLSEEELDRRVQERLDEDLRVATKRAAEARAHHDRITKSLADEKAYWAARKLAEAQANAYNAALPKGAKKMLVLGSVATLDYDPAEVEAAENARRPLSGWKAAIAAGTVVALGFVGYQALGGGDDDSVSGIAVAQAPICEGSGADAVTWAVRTWVFHPACAQPGAPSESAAGEPTAVALGGEDPETAGDPGSGDADAPGGGDTKPPAADIPSDDVAVPPSDPDPVTPPAGAKTATVATRRTCYGSPSYLEVTFASPARPGDAAALIMSISGERLAKRTTATATSSGALRFVVPVPGSGRTLRVASLDVEGERYGTDFGSYTTPSASGAGCPAASTTTTTMPTTTTTTTMPTTTTTTTMPTTTTTAF